MLPYAQWPAGTSENGLAAKALALMPMAIAIANTKDFFIEFFLLQENNVFIISRFSRRKIVLKRVALFPLSNSPTP
jgi:predicted ABC-type sugar transport system permease subunit